MCSPTRDQEKHGFLKSRLPNPTCTDFGATAFESGPGTVTPMLGYNFDAYSEYWEEGNRA